MLRHIILSSLLSISLFSSVYAEEIIIPQESTLTLQSQTEGTYLFKGEQQLTGLLKARWGKDLTSDNQLKIYLQFFPEQKQAKLLPTINDQYKNSNQTISLNIDSNQQVNTKLVKEVFKQIPSSFWQYKEGILEQPVTITINQFKAEGECDYRYYYAHLVKVTAIENTTDTIKEKKEGCNSYIFDTTFLVQSKDGYTNLRSEPNSKAKIIKQLSNDSTVKKIKTIGSWYYIDVLKASGESTNILGYIHKSQLVEMD